VEELHENPFLWWTGQFAKFTMRLTKEQTELVNKAKQKIGMDKWSHPTVGYASLHQHHSYKYYELIHFSNINFVYRIHVRRTDKTVDAKGSWHELEEYFNATEIVLNEFFNRFHDRYRSKTVFIASDDNTVLEEARQRYFVNIST